jgi:2-oxoglutarate ferredoxin oxidoreductase subunit delta
MYIDRERINIKGYNPAATQDIEKCIACAMCAIMCPDSAITVEKE